MQCVLFEIADPVLLPRGMCIRKSTENVVSLTRDEYQQAERFWQMKTQSFNFLIEIKAYQKGDDLQRSSNLFGLSSFLDSHGVLRVGGRLTHAPIPYAAKYPIIFDGRSHIAKLIIQKRIWKCCMVVHSSLRVHFVKSIGLLAAEMQSEMSYIIVYDV